MTAGGGASALVDHRGSRAWVDTAIRLIEADATRSADTHLLRFPPPEWA